MELVLNGADWPRFYQCLANVKRCYHNFLHMAILCHSHESGCQVEYFVSMQPFHEARRILISSFLSRSRMVLRSY